MTSTFKPRDVIKHLKLQYYVFSWFDPGIEPDPVLIIYTHTNMNWKIVNSTNFRPKKYEGTSHTEMYILN